MGTDKRARQKANRAQRQQELDKAESRRRGVRIGAIVIGLIVLVFGLVWIATVFLGDDDDTTTADTIVDTVSDTIGDPVVSSVSTEPVGSDPVANDPAVPVVSSPGVSEPVVSEPGEGDGECPPDDGVTEPVREFDSPPPTCIDPAATYQAVVTTNKGEFVIDLDASAAPATVNNFVFLSRNGYYDDTPCHRIITDFVVQCGDPTGTGTGGPGYEFDDELPEAGEYQLGSVVMANAGPNTNGSQFFIVTGEQGVALPPQYALFGQVTEGFDSTVADMAATGSASGEPTEPVEIISIRIVTS